MDVHLYSLSCNKNLLIFIFIVVYQLTHSLDQSLCGQLFLVLTAIIRARPLFLALSTHPSGKGLIFSPIFHIIHHISSHPVIFISHAAFVFYFLTSQHYLTTALIFCYISQYQGLTALDIGAKGHDISFSSHHPASALLLPNILYHLTTIYFLYSNQQQHAQQQGQGLAIRAVICLFT